MEFKWDSSMSVKEETIDDQHKGLLDQINKLAQVLSSLDINMDTLREVNHFLYTYFKEHFSYEEEYMAKNNFPGLEAHKKIHQEFIKFYEEFQKEIKEKTTSKEFSSLELKELLKKVKVHLADWLINHIKGIDQEYVKYIESH